MRRRAIAAVLLGLLATGVAASASAAASPTVSVTSWHRQGTMEFLTLRICGRTGPQTIRITETTAHGSRRLTFATSTESTVCAARNVYWEARSTSPARTSIAVQLRSRGAASALVRRSQTI